MPEPLTSYVSDCYDDFILAKEKYYNMASWIVAAGNKLKLGDMGGAGNYLVDGGVYGQQGALNYLHARYGFHLYHIIDALEWIDYNWPSVEPFVLKMSDIIDAMSAASPIEIMYFIGIVDAMRQSIWNKPFESTFFAALARAFER